MSTVTAGQVAASEPVSAQSTTPTFSDPQFYSDVPPVYSDVRPGEFERLNASTSYHRIQSLARAGVFDGTDCATGRFCPEASLTRWQLAVWLARSLGHRDLGAVGRSRFADVDPGEWWAPYVERLAELGIATGCSTGPANFCPQAAVDRGQLAGFLARGIGLPARESVGFGDIANHPDAAAINSAATFDILEGCSQQPLRFCPTASVSKAQAAMSIIAALDSLQANTVAESSPVPGDIFLTHYNEFSWYVKTQVIDRYGDDQPWLKAAWNLMNRMGSIYMLMPGYPHLSVNYGATLPYDGRPRVIVRVIVTGPHRLKDSGNHYAIVHELAHVYTTSSDRVAEDSLPIAAAHLYFEEISGGVDRCIPYEIFADTAPQLIFDTSSTYWGVCSANPYAPTDEAIEVVRDAFSGVVPQWFYDTFQRPDGSLDYEAIWSAVVEIHHSQYGNGAGHVISQLWDSFGGYCPAYSRTAGVGSDDSIFINPGITDQPWVDGGCDEPATADDPQRADSDDAAINTAEVRIVARKLASGRIEFGLQQRNPDNTWASRQLPRVRFFPTTAGTNRWLASSALDLPLGEVRIVARKLASGRIEFGLQQRNPDNTWDTRQLPRVRFFPTSAGTDRWLASSPLTLTAPQPAAT